MSEEDKKIFQRLIYYNDKEHLAKRIIELQHNIKDLWAQLQQKENIIKEAINYIKEESWFCYKDNEEIIDRTLVNKLLEILEVSNE